MILLFAMLSRAEDGSLEAAAGPPDTPEEGDPSEDLDISTLPGDPLTEQPAWCTEPTRLSRADQDWCGAVPAACAGLKEACAKAPPPTQRATVSRRLPPQPMEMAQPITLGAQRVMLGVMLGLALLAVIGWFFGPKEEETEIGERETGPSPAPSPVFVPRREDELLAAAQRAGRDGRPGEALMLLRAAIVRALERSGTLTADPGRTDRETVRALASDPELAAPVRVVASALERQRYAALPVDRPTLDAAFSATQRVLTRLGMIVVLLGIGVAHAGPADHEHLGDWLEANGFFNSVVSDFPEDPELLVWTPDTWTTATEVARARLAAERGSTVFVAADADVLSLFAPEVDELVPARGGIVLDLGTPPSEPLALPSPLWTFTGKSGTNLLVDGAKRPFAVIYTLGAGEIVLFGSPHVFDDASLLVPANAAALGRVFRQFGHPAVRVLSLTAPSATPLRAMVAAGLGPVLLQLGLIWAFWAWSRGRRFAGPVAVLDDSRRDFRGHLDAVATLYRGVNATRSGAAASIGRSFHLLREHTRAPDVALVSAVADRSGYTRERVATLFSLARRIVGDPNGASPGADHPVQEEMWTLVERTRRRDGSAASPRGSRRSKARSAG